MRQCTLDDHDYMEAADTQLISEFYYQNDINLINLYGIRLPGCCDYGGSPGTTAELNKCPLKSSVFICCHLKSTSYDVTTNDFSSSSVLSVLLHVAGRVLAGVRSELRDMFYRRISLQDVIYFLSLSLSLGCPLCLASAIISLDY